MDKVFRAMGINGDGKLSREEWDLLLYLQYLFMKAMLFHMLYRVYILLAEIC
jgi:hypothetical protein